VNREPDLQFRTGRVVNASRITCASHSAKAAAPAEKDGSIAQRPVVAILVAKPRKIHEPATAHQARHAQPVRHQPAIERRKQVDRRHAIQHAAIAQRRGGKCGH
jgi:hypothetical protein